MSRSRKSPPAPVAPATAAAGRPKLISTVLMLACTAVMLPLLFPPFYCFFLAPVALVPFCVCILRRPLTWRYVLAYYLTGVAFWGPNLFWLGPVTVGGFIGLALFVALYFALFAFGVQRLVVQLRMPATLAVPLVWTAVEYMRATFVLGGFPWFMLGNCLTPMPVLIQAADIFGVWGLTFILAMLNGLVVDILRLPLRQGQKGKTRFSPVIGRLIAMVSLTVAAYLGYGVYRLGESATRPGPRVAVIQENVPQSLKESPESRDEVFIEHLELARRAATSVPKPDLVAWPETMVTSPINEDLIEKTPDSFQTTDELRAALQRAEAAKDAYRRVDDVYKALSDLVTGTGVPELVGYGAYIPETGQRPAVIQNRTLLLVPGTAGALRAQEYSKRHLVPFGEYIPFRGVPVLSGMMLWFSPVDYDYSNTPGSEWTRFRMTVSSRSADAAATQITSSTRFYEFGTPICFEDIMPEPAREMARAQGAGGVEGSGGRKADFLVNVSNDGWFLGVELDQHLQACQLRAVENRISIARSVNTGNSGFIDSCGRIVKLVRDGNGNSLGAVGTESWVMEIDARETFFSRIGDVFPIICGVIATLLVGWTLVRPRRAGTAATSAAL